MSSAAYTLLATSSRSQSPSTPTQASMPAEQLDLVEILRSGEDSRLRRYRPDRTDTVASPTVVLFCGADQETEADWDEHRPWVVEMLPETAPPPARKRQKRSNGCGARVHTRAVADRRWRGLVKGVSVDVVGLADKYFTSDMKRELMLGKERCGCSRTGVGCAICGNPLGALLTPCERHAPSSPTSNFSSSHYTFLHAAVSPPLPPPMRRVSIPNDDARTGRGEREALQRRIREREELHLLRARVRAAQQPHSRPPPRGDTSRAEWERRIDEVRMQESVNGRAAFDAWADATLQRATATAASDVPVVVDLSALMDLRRSASPPDPATTTAPREVSEEERRRDWQRGVAGRFGRDWPIVTRTIERTTAPPEPLSRRITLQELRQSVTTRTVERTTATPESLPQRRTLDEVLGRNNSESSTTTTTTAATEPLPGAVVALEELPREAALAREIERGLATPETVSRRLTLQEALRRIPSETQRTTTVGAERQRIENAEEQDKEEEASARRRIFFER
ncbi:hypothetical protein MVEN_01061300 [Mycena venus]|uniref:Uncharacterized protein n=1 Tax=Mycena venus TaxID=2733690 RepID=A0A8H6Y7B5_9AGAR|nr:hypothetical protein MVEN_01061300 [Mycena venus]